MLVAECCQVRSPVLCDVDPARFLRGRGGEQPGWTHTSAGSAAPGSAASGGEEVAAWNEWVQRYHPLGYRQPIGNHVRYWLRDRRGRQLGCLLFDFAARQLACRDRWIGWQEGTHRKHLRLVVRNARYLLLPWVRVKNLASHALVSNLGAQGEKGC